MRCYLPDYYKSLLSNLPAHSCPSVVSSPPSSMGDSLSGEVRPCFLLYSKPSQSSPPHRVTANVPTTACKTLHDGRQIILRTALHHPPLVHSIPATPRTLSLKHCMQVPASGPLHLPSLLPGRFLPNILMAPSLPSFGSSVRCHLLSEDFAGRLIETFNCCHLRPSRPFPVSLIGL